MILQIEVPCFSDYITLNIIFKYKNTIKIEIICNTRIICNILTICDELYVIREYKHIQEVLHMINIYEYPSKHFRKIIETVSYL